MRKAKIFILIIILIVPYMLLGCASPKLVDSGLDYTESMDILDNPGRGFYFAIGANLKPSDNGSVKSAHIASKKGTSRILHLRVGLEAFSTNAGGTDSDISEDALRFVEDYMKAARDNGMGVIFRMSYDINGAWSNGYRQSEPSVTLMQRHIEQMGEALSNHPDVLLAIESGMLGPWGEQHGTTAAGVPENYFRITQKWLEVAPDITISVRRPLYFVYWYNARHNTAFTIDTINEIPASQPNTDEYRVGVYNDGYLGSHSDLGTYTNREKEVAWLNKQASHTFFGGEAVADSGGNLIGDYNNVGFLETEGFITHTSYLNIEWNNNLIAKWEENSYNGNDPIYKGKTTELHYVKNHLGYRFVLRESLLSENAKRGGSLRLKGKIENVGFAPILIKTNAKIILLHEDGEQTEIPIQFDLNASFYDISVAVPQNLSNGNYTVYIAFTGGIALANNGEIYNPTLSANKLGSLKVT